MMHHIARSVSIPTLFHFLYSTWCLSLRASPCLSLDLSLFFHTLSEIVREAMEFVSCSLPLLLHSLSLFHLSLLPLSLTSLFCFVFFISLTVCVEKEEKANVD